MFKEMEAKREITILSPFGVLLVNIPLPDDNIDYHFSHPLPTDY